MYNRRNILAGFTLAEMILAMAIVAILTIATVPMLKYHKVRPKEDFTPHGIIECYYTDDGHLHMYTRDNDKNVLGKDEDYGAARTFCEFPVPKANYYELHVIGAGGPGGGYTDDQRNEIFNGTKTQAPEEDSQEETVTINVNESFYNQVQSLNSFVRELWEQDGRSAHQKFTITAPRGTGSYVRYVPATKYNISEDGTTVVPEQYQKKISYGAGNSAPEPFDMTAYVKPTSKINVAKFPGTYSSTATPILQIDGVTKASVTGTVASGGSSKGNTGICNGISDEYDNYACGNEISVSGGGTPTTRKNETGVNGTIESSLTLKYTLADLTYLFGESGAYGVYSRTYYENMKAKKLRLTPAFPVNNINNSTVETITVAGIKLTLYTTDGKRPVGYKDTYKSVDEGYINKDLLIKSIQSNNLPVPEEFKEVKDKIKPQTSVAYHTEYCKLESPENSSTKGMCQKVDSGTIKNPPGTPGYGAYPILYKLTDDISKAYLIDSYEKRELNKNDNSIKADNSANSCYYSEASGVEPEEYGDNMYCRGTKGSPGAIIILW